MKAAWRVLVGASYFAISIGSAYPAIPDREQVIETILRASRDVGVDEIYMLALADKEFVIQSNSEGTDVVRDGALPVHRANLAGIDMA